MPEEKKQKQEIPAMRGSFAIRGIVTAFDKVEGFESKTKTNKNMRKITFDVSSNEGNVHKMEIRAIQGDKVYFSGKVKKEDGTEENVTQEVAWKDRLKFKKEGLQPIDRITFGLEKEKDEETGKEKNKREVMITFDAIEKIFNLLEVGMSVYIRGNIQVEEYTTNKGEKRNSTKFYPNQIFLTQEPIDFKAEDFKETAQFELTAAVEEIEINGSEEATITGLVIGREKLGRQTLVFKQDPSLPEDYDLAKWINVCKNIQRAKKYWTGTFVGNIINGAQSESQSESTEVDEWGIPTSFTSPMRSRLTGFTREFLCLGILSGSVDTLTYTEESVDNFINQQLKPKEEYGEVQNADDFVF